MRFSRLHTLQIPKLMHMEDTCVFKRTGKASEEKHGKGTFAIHRTRLIEWRPYNYVISTIETEETRMPWQRRNSDFGNVEMWKDTSVREREKDHRKEYPARTRNDRNPERPYLRGFGSTAGHAAADHRFQMGRPHPKPQTSLRFGGREPNPKLV